MLIHNFCEDSRESLEAALCNAGRFDRAPHYGQLSLKDRRKSSNFTEDLNFDGDGKSSTPG